MSLSRINNGIISNVSRALSFSGRTLSELFLGQPALVTPEHGAIPAILEQDNGILLAAPKKKVSHQKKRQRLLAPGKKHVQMMHHLNRCPSCGHYKRANTICMHCFENVRFLWKSYIGEKPQEPLQEQQLTELDKRVLYPGKMDTAYVEKLKDKDSYLERRMRTLPKDK